MNKEIGILQEILDYQEKIFNFIKREEFFLETSLNEEKLLKLISGLAIISSIYEKFTTKLITIYCDIFMKTEKEKDGIIQNNKSIGNLSKMIKELKLEVDKMYGLLKLNNDFEKNDILKKDSNFLTYGDLIAHMNTIYQKRNKYVHGAFEINENIDKEKFEKYVLDTLDKESAILLVLKNAFISKIPYYLIEREELTKNYKKYEELYNNFFENIDNEIIKEKSQFFTPIAISQKLVDDLKHLNKKFKKENIKILDPSCGFGILTINLLEKIVEISSDPNKRINKIEVDMIDIDEKCIENCKIIIKEFLEKNNLNDLVEVNYIIGNYLNYEIKRKYDFIVQNPPFKKIKKEEKIKYDGEITKYINGQANLYHLFIIKSLKLLDEKGILFTISPKNFLSGKYTENLRKFLFNNYSLTRLHLFDERKKIFKNIIQEICITQIEKRKHKNIKISYNGSKPFELDRETLFLKSKNNILLSPRNREESNFIKSINEIFVKNDIFSFHPGKVVQFRVDKRNLSSEKFNKEKKQVPLLVPKHLKNGRIKYKDLDKKKNNSISIFCNEETQNLFLKNKRYIILNKNSGKEEKKLIKPVLYDGIFDIEYIALDNNLAYIEFFDNNVSDFIFYGAFCILNSEQFDIYYRMINGSHTLNSYEFQNLLFPKEEILEKIGREYLKTEEKNSMEKCSEIFEKYIKNK